MNVAPPTATTTEASGVAYHANILWPDDEIADSVNWCVDGVVRCSGTTRAGARCRITRTLTGMLLLSEPPLALCHMHEDQQVEAALT